MMGGIKMDDSRSVLSLVAIILGLAVAYFYFQEINSESPPPQQQQQQQPWQPPVTPEPPQPPETPEQPPQQEPPRQINSYKDALAAAKATNKQIYLYFSASWCTWCKKFSSETLSSPRVQNELDNYIVYKVDVDKERTLASKYGVSGIPAHRVIDANEQTIKSGSGYKGEAAFILWLKTALLEYYQE